MSGDGSAYGRVRGPVARTAQRSCIGGLVFEYTDEWWKGDKADEYHGDCADDNASTHSACGFSNEGFGPDGRMNEEWFGLYNATYEADEDYPYTVTLHPRGAVRSLQRLWGSAAAAPAPVRGRALLQAASGVYTTYFPRAFRDYVTEGVVLAVLAACACLMTVMIVLSLLWGNCVGPKKDSSVHLRDEGEADAGDGHVQVRDDRAGNFVRSLPSPPPTFWIVGL